VKNESSFILKCLEKRAGSWKREAGSLLSSREKEDFDFYHYSKPQASSTQLPYSIYHYSKPPASSTQLPSLLQFYHPDFTSF